MIISQGVFKGRQMLLIDPEPTVDDQFRFLGLPPEIRNMIYDHLLGGEGDPLSISMARNNRGFHSLRTGHGYRTNESIALLSSCKQVSLEATPVFYGINKFEFACTTSMSRFLDSIGSNVRLLKKISVQKVVHSTMRKAFASLHAATSLDSLHFRLLGSFRYNWYPEYTARVLRGLFTALQGVRNDREAVFTILSLARYGSVVCRKHGSYPSASVCNKQKEHEEKHMADIKQAVFQYLTDKPKECIQAEGHSNTMGNSDSSADMAGVSDEDDDYSYLTAAAEPAQRRDTGRPKQRAVTEKNISYMEV